MRSMKNKAKFLSAYFLHVAGLSCGFFFFLGDGYLVVFKLGLFGQDKIEAHAYVRHQANSQAIVLSIYV